MCFDSFEKERFDASEFIVLIPLPTRSMLLMIPVHDLIAMYLAIELQSLCFYVIAASKRKSEFSTEAGSKYLILGVFPSGILLFGCDRTTTDQFLCIHAYCSYRFTLFLIIRATLWQMVQTHSSKGVYDDVPASSASRCRALHPLVSSLSPPTPLVSLEQLLVSQNAIMQRLADIDER
jgi:hypothetical protein